MGGKSYLAGISRQRSSQTASSIWRGKLILSWHSLQVLSECNSFSCKCTSVCANSAQVLFAWVFPWVCGSGSPPVLWLLRPVEKGCEPAEQAWFVVVFLGSVCDSDSWPSSCWCCQVSCKCMPTVKTQTSCYVETRVTWRTKGWWRKKMLRNLQKNMGK